MFKIHFFSLFFSECGVSSFSPNLKIVGGSEAIPNSWPSAAYITYEYVLFGYSYSASCGGSLISRNVILTAAHCICKKYYYQYNGNLYFYPILPNPTYEAMLTVYLGVDDITKLYKYKKAKVSKLIIVISFSFFVLIQNKIV